MSRFTDLRSRFANPTHHTTGRRQLGPQPRSRPLALERLEDRSLLTAGMLDPTFGEGGKVVTQFADSTVNYSGAIAVQPDGKLVVVGMLPGNGVPPYPQPLVATRFNADGTVDSAFGSNGTVIIDTNAVFVTAPNIISANPTVGLEVQPDGKIVFAYSKHNSTSVWNPDFAVARLNADGSFDTAFNGTGKMSYDFGGTRGLADYARDIALQPDGRIIVVGSTDAESKFAVMRLNTEGQLDGSFGVGGTTTIDFQPYIRSVPEFDPFFGNFVNIGTTIDVQADGKLILGGVNPGGGEALVEIARLNANGTADTTFGQNGLSAWFDVNQAVIFSTVALGPSGEIVIGCQGWGGVVVFGVSAEGDLAPVAFLSSIADDLPIDIQVQADGRILIAGSANNRSEFRIARLNADFTVDTTFGNAGTQAIGFATSPDPVTDIAARLTVQPDGRIVVLGTSTQHLAPEHTRYLALARLTSDNIFDAPFADTDSDGIQDSIDGQPSAFSNDFSDIANGGTTSGSITTRGQQVLFVEDAASPKGVLIAAHVLGGSVPASVSIEGKAATLTLDAGDQVVATHGSVILDVLAGSIEISYTGDNEKVAQVVLSAGNGLTFDPETFTFSAPEDNATSVLVVVDGRNVEVSPGTTVDPQAARSVVVDVLPDSLNIDSNGLISVVIFGAADFDTSRIDVGSVRFAGAAATQWVWMDANGDGYLDLQLKFRREDTILEQLYAQLLAEDLDGDGVLDSTRQIAEVSVTGETLDDLLFAGSDSITLFLAGKNLRDLLTQLFG